MTGKQQGHQELMVDQINDPVGILTLSGYGHIGVSSITFTVANLTGRCVCA